MLILFVIGRLVSVCSPMVALGCFILETMKMERDHKYVFENTTLLKHGLFKVSWSKMIVTLLVNIMTVAIPVVTKHEYLAAAIAMVYIAEYYIQFNFRHQAKDVIHELLKTTRIYQEGVQK
jgi:hypothetical protein